MKAVYNKRLILLSVIHINSVKGHSAKAALMAVTGKRWKKNPTNYEKNKFLLGGNFRDPLNLNSLSDEKVIDKDKLAYVDYFKDS